MTNLTVEHHDSYSALTFGGERITFTQGAHAMLSAIYHKKLAESISKYGLDDAKRGWLYYSRLFGSEVI